MVFVLTLNKFFIYIFLNISFFVLIFWISYMSFWLLHFFVFSHFFKIYVLFNIHSAFLSPVFLFNFKKICASFFLFFCLILNFLMSYLLLYFSYFPRLLAFFSLTLYIYFYRFAFLSFCQNNKLIFIFIFLNLAIISSEKPSFEDNIYLPYYLTFYVFSLLIFIFYSFFIFLLFIFIIYLFFYYLFFLLFIFLLFIFLLFIFSIIYILLIIYIYFYYLFF